jgi:hypothetical protein
VVLANGRWKCGACDFGGPTERVHLVGVSKSFEKNFSRLPFTPPLSGRLIGPSDHDYNIYCLNLMPQRRCPSCIRHQFVPSLYSGHVITYSRMFPLPSAKQPFCRMMACSRPQASLPNALRKISCRMVFSYQTRPRGQSLSCTNFWC